MAIEIIDSYPESNKSNHVPTGFLYNLLVGQTFYCTDACVLDSCKFYLKKSSAPTGVACAVIYEITGTPGTDAVPTGTPIATSGNVDVSTISDSVFELITFNFAGAERIDLSAATHYAVVLKYLTEQYGGFIETGDDDTSPSDDGNSFSTLDGTNWDINCGNAFDTDVVFYVYGEFPEPDPDPEPSVSTGNFFIMF